MPPALVRAARSLGDDEVLFFGVAPARVDLLRSISGVSFEEARKHRIRATLGSRSDVPVIGLADLITNKRASARPQDLADVKALQRAAKASPPRTARPRTKRRAR